MNTNLIKCDLSNIYFCVILIYVKTNWPWKYRLSNLGHAKYWPKFHTHFDRFVIRQKSPNFFSRQLCNNLFQNRTQAITQTKHGSGWYVPLVLNDEISITYVHGYIHNSFNPLCIKTSQIWERLFCIFSLGYLFVKKNRHWIGQIFAHKKEYRLCLRYMSIQSTWYMKRLLQSKKITGFMIWPSSLTYIRF